MTTKISIVIDDDEDMLRIMKGYLKNLGFIVYAFSNPKIAYEHFAYRPTECSLIVTDIRMPGMSGLELASKTKALNPDVKVFLMTEFPIEESEFSPELPSTMIDGILEKPFFLKDVSLLIKKMGEEEASTS